MQKQGMVKEGEEVALVQSGRQPIWRFQSTHNIQVQKVQTKGQARVAQLVTAEEFPRQLLGGWPRGSGV